ncbi:MAG TPA: tRNA uridine-5-carboxymethylaminomethyl(34) synthesis GTPase MnmE [Deltaproteobacteria bacterium]|nr:tRNA uridine-5-carboxymethylaminomethyl(34) synthesis GTPase MnmE [Deltaproteobacteria bacterium]
MVKLNRMSIHEDTIAAIATPHGVGGIGIIRISGPEAEKIGFRLFRPKQATVSFRSHHLYHGDIVVPETGMMLDEVLLTVMRKPHSYTGEDTVEIHCHGGPALVDGILKAVLAEGARPAEPGEFTKRAFLNDRMDLSQAEAVINLIHAQTNRGIELALSHLKGRLSHKVQSLRSSLIDILSHLEITIDFTEEDLDLTSSSNTSGMIRQIIDNIGEILATYREGKIASSGLTVVITGKPNVGKSSLLNKLLGEQRAIITPIPGTTRDFIEGDLHIKGIPIKLIDTAGVRNGEDVIEKEGIKLVWEKASVADVVIILLDGSTALTAEDREVIDRNKGKQSMVVINKSDLPHILNDSDLEDIHTHIPHRISAKQGDGLAELREKLYAIARKALNDDDQSDIVLTNLRHKEAFEKASEHLHAAYAAVLQGMSPEFSALDIKEALDALGEIVGDTAPEDVLDRIFSTFCIGK